MRTPGTYGDGSGRQDTAGAPPGSVGRVLVLGHAVAHDPDELLRIEAGAADKCSVDVLLSHDPGDVVGLHRAAIEDAHTIGETAGVELSEPGAQ